MLAQYIQYLALFVLFGVFEVVYPAFRNSSFKGRFRNFVYSLLLVFAGGGMVLIVMAIVPFQPRMVNELNLTDTILLSLAYLLTFDFLFYWYHRAQHHYSLLWPIHELHHADTELNATSTLRAYWLEQPLQNIIIYIPMFYVLGYNQQSVTIFGLVLIVVLVFSHTNVKLSMKYLTPVLCGPQLHRIHHSMSSQHLNKNFAQIFPLFDIVFGTYYKPKSGEFPKTGTSGQRSDEGFIKVLFKPFQVWYNRLNN